MTIFRLSYSCIAPFTFWPFLINWKFKDKTYIQIYLPSNNRKHNIYWYKCQRNVAEKTFKNMNLTWTFWANSTLRSIPLEGFCKLVKFLTMAFVKIHSKTRTTFCFRCRTRDKKGWKAVCKHFPLQVSIIFIISVSYNSYFETHMETYNIKWFITKKWEQKTIGTHTISKISLWSWIYPDWASFL